MDLRLRWLRPPRCLPVNIIIWQGVDENVLTLEGDPRPLDQAAFVRLMAYYAPRLRSDSHPGPQDIGGKEEACEP